MLRNSYARRMLFLLRCRPMYTRELLEASGRVCDYTFNVLRKLVRLGLVRRVEGYYVCGDSRVPVVWNILTGFGREVVEQLSRMGVEEVVAPPKPIFDRMVIGKEVE